MEFKVKRSTSIDTGRLKPCEEAHPNKKGGWSAEINTLEELCGLVRKYNCLVIYEDKDQLTIKICDNY